MPDGTMQSNRPEGPRGMLLDLEGRASPNQARDAGAARLRTPHALLTVLFLKQFLENDLISPDADRSQLVAVVGAMFLSLTLLGSVFLSFNYVMGTLTPGQLSVLAMNDRFFYLGLAMVVMALLATSQWDALALGPRDAAILEPLPLGVGIIRRAKLSAVAILGAATAIAINVFPSIIFPWLLVFNLRDLSLAAVLWLIAVHAVLTVAAAGFGYLAVIAFRETLAAVLGARLFTRASPWLQGGLIVALGGALLLLPPATTRIAERGFSDWRANAPPMWFLGAYELAAGGVVADYPRSAMMKPRQAENDRATTARYESRRGAFRPLALRAGLALGVTFFIAALAYLWNARRLPSLAATAPAARRRRWLARTRVARLLFARRAGARAGFDFAVAAMWRSSTHRLTLACATAAGLAMAVVALSEVNLEPGGGASPRLLSLQPLLYGALLVGFRHVIRVPAELRANWGFQLAWRGHERAFVSGVKGAALVALVLPALLVVLPLFTFVLGWRLAFVHAGLGLAGAVVLLEALMFTYDKVPFTCTYLPNENMKALAPVLGIAFLIGASMFARMQHAVLQGTGALRFALTLGVVFLLLRVIALKRVRLPQVEFDEAPATFQRLGLDK